MQDQPRNFVKANLVSAPNSAFKIVAETGYESETKPLELFED